MSKDVHDFSKTLMESHGLGELSAKKYASYMGAMLESSGIHGQVMKDMSMDLTKLTADMASFYNLENEEMFQKLLSGMSGQTMPLKKLGINMNIAALEAFSLSQGIGKAWREMSQAEQVMTRYQYLVSVTSHAQGDFARNADNWAHSTKILNEKWKEFMGTMGVFIKEVAVPVVHALIKIVDMLIAMGRALGKVYTIITGKELTVEANSGIADTAFDAAEGELELADGINKAAKAAKGALMSFDELNILQSNLGAGGGGNLAGTVSDGGLNTVISTKQIDEGLKVKIDDEEPKKFFVWFEDKWTRLKDALMIPVQIPIPVIPILPKPIFNPEWNLNPPLVPKPVFQPIPKPVYEPEWNLNPPLVPKPVFQPIPKPVYEPEWNLNPPLVPKPVFQPIPKPVYEPVWNLNPPPVPAVEREEYNQSLEDMQIETVGVLRELNILVAVEYDKMKDWTLERVERLRESHAEKWESIREGTREALEGLSVDSAFAWDIQENNFETHKENMGIVSSAIATVLVANAVTGLSKLGINTNNAITTLQDNWQVFGASLGLISFESAKAIVANMSEGFKSTVENTVAFANSHLKSMKQWGEGMLSIAAQTARGFVENMVSGFSKVWQNFKDLMEGIEERVSGWFSANKSLVLKTTIAAGVIVGAGALALAAPAAIPYIGTALGGLASIPALAKGGITSGPTLAMIGDNPGGKEVVSPLDGLLEMIVDAVSTTNNSNSGDTTIIVKIGEDTITEKVVSNINRQNRISGKTVIQV